jgi:hypothetical protein
MNLQESSEQEPSGLPPASQAQQEQFDLLLGRARQIIGESAQEWAQGLKLDAVSMAVKMGTGTLRQLVQMSTEAGQEVDPAVLINVGVTLVKDIAGIANHANIVTDDKLESFMQEVMQLSIAEYLRMDADDGLIQGGAQPAIPQH